ncbi:hypothetical protein [Aliivibrio finisterrensis]|uniref:Tail fiber assembly protein n=1 Tax=Aliivibrio finisterrensis TaxID=511998 RepID=A0ABY0I6X0_9GAMM|nr:hypothetical protein [Aliivibrio finisterrensis]RYU50030.1 hypothetical protein ERW56_15770 [Aliivibrio finisterrensis]RYU55731.1 hypothetical protein ERW50_15825 [Aliivibrio finisterrensis]RYU62185.1 hypothetical protein ERW53_16880 [Aliivibrio finisterrensis]RYU80922.1 hypothetical protein ERW55_15640 [Aliivibrio finisterrensis]RYU84465.1 hypothetical protein ERW52_10865 [Aliivibrio finisterrensis]
MTQFFNKSQNVDVSRISSEGWWLENCIEHVVKGTALGSDFTQDIYTPSSNGMIARYDRNLNQWSDEIEDMTWKSYFNGCGYLFYIGEPEGDYPEWAIKETPPEYDNEKQTVLYEGNAWKVYSIELGKSYWDGEANEFIISDYNFTLPEKHTFTEPPKAEKGFAVRLVDGQWQQIEDHRNKIIYNCSDCTQSEQVEELGIIKESFTFDEPVTLHDEWIDSQWVTNQSNKYIADFNRVDEVRRDLYARVCDPLIAEANIKRLMGYEQEAADMETQALAARSCIQMDNPWPELLI